jgi:hypothetical protein
MARMIFWVVGFGSGAAVLCLRANMIESAMVVAILAVDPSFKPRYSTSLDPSERTYNLREYRRRLPDGPLTAKMWHVHWALGLWFILAIVVALLIR